MSNLRKKSIQHGAHVFLLLSVAWGLLSLFALFDWFDAHRTIKAPAAQPDLIIWGIQLILASFAGHLLRTERKRDVLWLESERWKDRDREDEDDPLLHPIPQQVDLSHERARLYSEFLHGLKLAGSVLTGLCGVTLVIYAWKTWRSGHFSDPSFLITWVLSMTTLYLAQLTLRKVVTYVNLSRRNRAFQQRQQVVSTSFH